MRVTHSQPFVDAVIDVFGPLAARRAMDVARVDDAVGFPRVAYAGNGTFLEVYMDRRERWITVHLGRVRPDGSVPEYREDFDSWFDLADVLQAKGVLPGKKVWAIKQPDDPAALRHVLTTLRALVEDHAVDVLDARDESIRLVADVVNKRYRR